ncbi:MAG: sulfite exporter TauE/SafE family protein [Pseudomonadota bacterium]
MTEADLTLYAAAMFAVLVAGISKGGFGAGLGFLATPFLALAVTPAEAAAIMLPVLILIDQVGMVSYWREWRWDVVWPVLISGAVGIALGTLAFGTFSADALRLGLGIIAIGFLLFQLAQKRGWTPPSRGGRGARAGLWGAVSGFTSTVSHAGGPPITIYLLGERLEKTVYQASSVLIFWCINLMKLGPYAALGVLDFSSLSFSLQLAPAAIVGVLFGVWAHKRVPEWLFFRAMVVLLALTGSKLIWDGARGLLG